MLCLWQIAIMRSDVKDDDGFPASPSPPMTEILSQGPDFTDLFTVTKSVYTLVINNCFVIRMILLYQIHLLTSSFELLYFFMHLIDWGREIHEIKCMLLTFSLAGSPRSSSSSNPSWRIKSKTVRTGFWSSFIKYCCLLCFSFSLYQLIVDFLESNVK